jgi:dihydroorotase
MSFSFTLPGLVDTHVHLRENANIIDDLIRYSFIGGAETVLFIGNTSEGLTNYARLQAYTECARWMVRPEYQVNIIPSLLVTEQTPLDEIKRASDAGIFDVKFLPLGRTTNSQKNGIRRYWNMIPIIAECGKLNIRVKMHPENPLMVIDNEDAEYQFLTFADMALNETEAEIWWEHATDGRCIPAFKEFAKTGHFSITLTAHHLLTNSSKSYGKSPETIKPSYKREYDRQAFIQLITENLPWVMAGTDSAPHPLEKKYCRFAPCACGAFTAPQALPLYAHALHYLLRTEAGRVAFKNFTSGNARVKLHLPPSKRIVTLTDTPFTMPEEYRVGNWTVEPPFAKTTINYSLAA